MTLASDSGLITGQPEIVEEWPTMRVFTRTLSPSFARQTFTYGIRSGEPLNITKRSVWMRVLRNGGLALLVFLGVAENVYRPDKAARVAAGRPIADRALPIHAKTLRDLRELPVDQSRFP